MLDQCSEELGPRVTRIRYKSRWKRGGRPCLSSDLAEFACEAEESLIGGSATSEMRHVHPLSARSALGFDNRRARPFEKWICIQLVIESKMRLQMPGAFEVFTLGRLSQC